MVPTPGGIICIERQPGAVNEPQILSYNLALRGPDRHAQVMPKLLERLGRNSRKWIVGRFPEHVLKSLASFIWCRNGYCGEKAIKSHSNLKRNVNIIYWTKT